jgi:hypothetical protein
MVIPENMLGISYDVQAGPVSLDALYQLNTLTSSNCQRLFQYCSYMLREIALPPEAYLSYEGSLAPDFLYPDLNQELLETLEIGDPVYWVNLKLFYPNGFPSFKYKLHITPSLGGLTFLHTTNPNGSRICTLTQMLDDGYAYYCANTIRSLKSNFSK